MSAQVVKEKAPKAPKAPKEAKAAKSPKKKMNVPPRQCDSSLPWAIHVYNIIKESNKSLTTQENVIDAYNAFVESILTLSRISTFRTYIPDYRVKYDSGIVIELMDDFRIKGLHYHMYPPKNSEAIKQMVDVYYILFELIKDDAVPYMKRKHEEYMNRMHKSLYTRQLKQHEQNLSAMSIRFDAMMQHYERAMHSLSEQYDKDHHRTMYEIEILKKKLVELEEGEVENEVENDNEEEKDESE